MAKRDRRFLFNPRCFGGQAVGPNPTDRAKNGCKRHLLTDGRGTPLALTHTGANAHDSTQVLALVEAIPPIKRPRGRPRRRPSCVVADRGYDYDAKVRRPLRERRIVPLIARRHVGHGSGLGKARWFVEAAAWLMHFRRLRVRYEKRDDIHEAVLILACVLICWNKVLRYC